MLVVIAVIVVLVGIALALGAKVTQSARSQASRDVILNLETSLAQFTTENEDQLPPASLEIENESGTQLALFPIADAREPGGSNFGVESDPAFRSGASVLAAMDRIVPGIIDSVASLDSDNVSTFEVRPGFTLSDGSMAATLVEPLDAFGEPIRFVHPNFAGGYGDFWDSSLATPALDTGRPTLDVRLGTYASGVGLTVMGADGRTPASPDISSIASGSGNVQRVELELRRSWKPFDPNDANARDDWVGDADEGRAQGGAGAYFYSGGADRDPGTRFDNVYTTQKPEYPLETKDLE